MLKHKIYRQARKYNEMAEQGQAVITTYTYLIIFIQVDERQIHTHFKLI